MANSLHFIQNQHLFLKKLLPLIDCFLIVEYERSKPSPWGPYSVGSRTLQQVRSTAGRETGDAAITLWRHDVFSSCSIVLVHIVGSVRYPDARI